MVQPPRLIRSTPPPLVVDVDGGLLACDPVRTALRDMLQLRPGAALAVSRSAPDIRPFALQALLAQPGAPLPRLPVRRVALDAIALWTRFGAPVVLISKLPEDMLAHLRDTLCRGAQLFGARPPRPLNASGKAELLCAVFGSRGFDLLADAKGADACARLARRAMLVGLAPQDKRRLLTMGVQATALSPENRSEQYVRLRAGAGWTVEWGQGAPETDAEPRPGTRLPSRDVSAAVHSRRGRAGRS